MNEDLISILSKKALEKYTYSDCDGDNWRGIRLNEKRFAELIIKECQRACNTYINDCGEVNGVPDSVFNSHFGIE